jgi:hypothetical protein
MSSTVTEPGVSSELRRRRDELAGAVAELQWNLGGLTYEMAIRDHFRLDLLLRRAAMLQERDAELAEVERLLHMQESSVAGSCTSCGAVRSRGAVFCWQCGAQLLEHSTLAGNQADAKTGGRDHAKPVAQTDSEAVERDAATIEFERADAVSNGSLARPVKTSA